MEDRIGIGYDIHRLVGERKLFIGGIEIPYVKGALGHSDADVLLHAICDALLGAVASGDIGEQFPDNDPKYLNISSQELLKKVMGLVKKKDYEISNVDTVVMLEEPALSAFKKQIRQNVARILEIKAEQVSIKAKTNEGLGEIGRKEAIACYAVALLVREE